MPFHIAPSAIRSAKPIAEAHANRAAASSARASQSVSFRPRVAPRANPPRGPNARNPRNRAPATCTMRKFQVSSGKLGRNGTSTPVSADSDSPFSAAMWKAA